MFLLFGLAGVFHLGACGEVLIDLFLIAHLQSLNQAVAVGDFLLGRAELGLHAVQCLPQSREGLRVAVLFGIQEFSAVFHEILLHGVEHGVGFRRIFADFLELVADFLLEGVHLGRILAGRVFLGVGLFFGLGDFPPQFAAVTVKHIRHDPRDDGGHHKKDQ